MDGLGLALKQAFEGVRPPNFFIVGAPKCGTTAMAASLALHPDVYMSPEKEPHAFRSDLSEIWPRMQPEAYVRLFHGVASESRVGEASVWYLRSRTAAHEIHDFDPNARIVAMLRNPVDLLYSLHSQAIRMGFEHIHDFRAALEAEPERRQGQQLMPPGDRYPGVLFYSEAVDFTRQLGRYMQFFDREQVHVVIMDDILNEPSAVMGQIQRFLKVEVVDDLALLHRNENRSVRSIRLQQAARESSFLGLQESSVVRRTGRLLLGQETRVRLARRTISHVNRINMVRRPRPPMPSELRAELTERFQPEVERLALLLGRDLSAWTTAAIHES
jgi:hypothetical protein